MFGAQFVQLVFDVGQEFTNTVGIGMHTSPGTSVIPIGQVLEVRAFQALCRRSRGQANW